MIYFTSDLHFSHSNITKYCPETRGHFTDVDEMNQAIVDGWNQSVTHNDEVWVLGDVSFHKNGDDARKIISQLKGKKHLVLGNHDQVVKRHCLDLFDTVQDYAKVYWQDESHPKGRWEFVCLHYPIISWDKRHHGSIHCHGHCHGSLKLPSDLQINMFDVGIDNPLWNFSPVSAKKLTELWINVKYLKPSDHHSTTDLR